MDFDSKIQTKNSAVAKENPDATKVYIYSVLREQGAVVFVSCLSCLELE